jgi:hypothetical protein
VTSDLTANLAYQRSICFTRFALRPGKNCTLSRLPEDVKKASAAVQVYELVKPVVYSHFTRLQSKSYLIEGLPIFISLNIHELGRTDIE